MFSANFTINVWPNKCLEPECSKPDTLMVIATSLYSPQHCRKWNTEKHVSPLNSLEALFALMATVWKIESLLKEKRNVEFYFWGKLQKVKKLQETLCDLSEQENRRRLSDVCVACFSMFHCVICESIQSILRKLFSDHSQTAPGIPCAAQAGSWRQPSTWRSQSGRNGFHWSP